MDGDGTLWVVALNLIDFRLLKGKKRSEGFWFTLASERNSACIREGLSVLLFVLRDLRLVIVRTEAPIYD